MRPCWALIQLPHCLALLALLLRFSPRLLHLPQRSFSPCRLARLQIWESHWIINHIIMLHCFSDLLTRRRKEARGKLGLEKKIFSYICRLSWWPEWEMKSRRRKTVSLLGSTCWNVDFESLIFVHRVSARLVEQLEVTAQWEIMNCNRGWSWAGLNVGIRYQVNHCYTISKSKITNNNNDDVFLFCFFHLSIFLIVLIIHVSCHCVLVKQTL